jgi:hypothetical protein
VLFRDDWAGARVEDIGRAFQDVELRVDHHQMLACQSERLLGFDQTHSQQSFDLVLSLAQLLGRRLEPMNRLCLTFDLSLQRFGALHGLGSLRLPGERSGLCVGDEASLYCDRTRGCQPESGQQSENKSLHGLPEYTTGTFGEPRIGAVMNAAPDSAWRLQQLAQILAESKALASTSARDTDPADVHIGSVALERIRRLTAQLTQQAATDIDDIDRLAMRLLLNDYTAAVAHLRAAMRLTEQRMAEATLPIQEAGLHVKQREKRAKGFKHKTT